MWIGSKLHPKIRANVCFSQFFEKSSFYTFISSRASSAAGREQKDNTEIQPSVSSSDSIHSHHHKKYLVHWAEKLLPFIKSKDSNVFRACLTLAKYQPRFTSAILPYMILKILEADNKTGIECFVYVCAFSILQFCCSCQKRGQSFNLTMGRTLYRSPKTQS